VRAGFLRDGAIQMHVGLARERGIRLAGDRDELRAAAFRSLRAGPEVQVRRDRVRAPEQDQLGVLELLDVRAHARAQGVAQSLGARLRADRAVEEARAELVEEALRHGLALDDAHRACVAVRHDALRVDGRDARKTLRDVRERLVPAHARELAGALGADTLLRIEQPVGVVDALEIARDLRAELAGRRRVRGVARDLDGHASAVAHLRGDEHRAGVGAIVRAGRPNDDAFGLQVGGHGLFYAMLARRFERQ
jgi:hypothetical protein